MAGRTEVHEIRTQPLTSEMQTQTTVLPVNSPKMADTKDGGNVSAGGIFLRWWECKLAKALASGGRVGWVPTPLAQQRAWVPTPLAQDVRRVLSGCHGAVDGTAPVFPLLSRPSLAEVSKLWDYSPHPACRLLLFQVLQHSHVIC